MPVIIGISYMKYLFFLNTIQYNALLTTPHRGFSVTMTIKVVMIKSIYIHIK